MVGSRPGGVIVSGFWLARIAASLGAMTVEPPPIPTDGHLPAWRRACLSYREIREAGGSDQEAHEAAIAAVRQVLPLLSRVEASAEAVNAYATKYHNEWFWRGAQHVRKWRTAH